MHFAPDTEESLFFAVELTDTDPGASRSGEDELATVDELAALLAKYPFSGVIEHSERELHDVRTTRDLLRRAWVMPRDELAAEVNRWLADAKAMPYLMRHDGIDWHLHATDLEAPLAERLRVESAMALIDVIRMDELGRLRVCEADDCTGLVLDLSRNGSKRYCNVRCANRMNMVAFRERQSAG
ncbi:CGNR zinc finger domain-containing protein [soil metagenome]